MAMFGENVAQVFRNNQQFQPFFLTDVTPTGKALGKGPFGSVEEVTYKHLTCAGKMIHRVHIEASNDEVVCKYLKACQLMSSLRHPNITRFLGLYFLSETQPPLLVMERLDTNLNGLLEYMPDLPLSNRLSVLGDVAHGLLYLHERPSPVIHGDLTANNVLITSSLVAKITDMGNSCIIELKRGQMHMPPEARDNAHRCEPAPSLDVFSLGHLSLYTLIQKIPCDLPSPALTKGNYEEVRLRNEVERQKDCIIDLLESRINSDHPTLVKQVKQCLHNHPQQRPRTDELLDTLQRTKAEVEGEHGSSPIRLDAEKLRLSKEVKELKQWKKDHKDEVDELHKDLKEISNRINEQNQVSIVKESDSPLVLQLKYKCGPDMPFEMTNYVQSVVVQGIVYVGGGYAIKKAKNSIIMAYNISSKKWDSLPSYMHPDDSGEDKNVCNFAMAVINSKLVLVGGWIQEDEENRQSLQEDQLESLQEGFRYRSKVLGVWDADNKQWRHPYPNMRTARSCCSAVVHNEWLVVAGGVSNSPRGTPSDGRADGDVLSSVEIMNINHKEWHDGPPIYTGVRWYFMKTAIVGDVCYFMGGSTGETVDDSTPTTKVYSVSLPNLISQLDSGDGDDQIWKEISGLQNTFCTPLSVDGSLLGFGGLHMKLAATAIHLYQPDSELWVHVGDLPTPRKGCTCALLKSQRAILVAGGTTMANTNELDKTMEIVILKP